MTSTISVTTLSTHTKQLNSFYECYIEICKKKNCHPLSIIKPARIQNKSVLGFVVDRVNKVEDWYPITKALSLDTTLEVITLRSIRKGVEFLHNVCTLRALEQIQRKNCLLWTDYIFRSLLRSLRLSLKRNPSLTTLVLDGIPLYPEYFNLLLESISKNTTLRSLSLKHSLIGDAGCINLCKTLKSKTNIEILNLSSCDLGPQSAKEIAKMINTHQNGRLLECWHNSLRYGDPNLSDTAPTGLKRITLNNNPAIGDEGLNYIINEFVDEEWIKALDMQKCGVTERMSENILDVLQQNSSLEIADFRFNDGLLPETLNKIFAILVQREQTSGTYYPWCEAASDSFSQTTLVSTNPLGSRSQVSLRPKSCSSRTSTNSSTTIDDDVTKQMVVLNDKLKQSLGKNQQLRKKNLGLKKLTEELECRWKKLEKMHPDLVEFVHKAAFDRERYKYNSSNISLNQTTTDISEFGVKLPLEGFSNSSNKSTERTLNNIHSSEGTERCSLPVNEDNSETEDDIFDYGYLSSDNESKLDGEELNSPSSKYFDFETMMNKVDV